LFGSRAALNPLRVGGPTHVHGITQEDVAQAPTFAEVVGDVLSRLAGVIFVGQNAGYDRDFLAAELSGAPALAQLVLPQDISWQDFASRLSWPSDTRREASFLRTARAPQHRLAPRREPVRTWRRPG
jgi:hypothetical protein